MTTVRFYCDVPKFKLLNGMRLYACTTASSDRDTKATRIFFDVDLPPGCWLDPKEGRSPAVAFNVQKVNK